jgi:hypothetical protein
MLDTLPTPNPQGLVVSPLCQKGVDQGRFAQSRLPRNEQDLTLTGQRHGQPVVEMR